MYECLSVGAGQYRSSKRLCASSHLVPIRQQQHHQLLRLIAISSHGAFLATKRFFVATTRNKLPTLFVIATVYPFSPAPVVVMNGLPSTTTLQLSPPTSLQSLSAKITPPPSLTLAVPWYPRLSTTFTAPVSCSDSLTMLQGRSCEIWNNEPVPAPAAAAAGGNLTFSACYADVFMTSYVQSIHGNTLPPFSPLVCPRDWETAYYEAAEWTGCAWAPNAYATPCWYIACCPK